MRRPKSYSKIAPETIEAWLISDDENEQRLATESLLHMSLESQKGFYRQVLSREALAYKGRSTRVSNYFILFCFCFTLILLLIGFVPQLVADPVHLTAVLHKFNGVIVLLLNVMIFLSPRMMCPPDSLLQKKVRERWLLMVQFEDLPLLIQEARHTLQGMQDVSPTLTTLLPRMTPEQRHLLSKEDWHYLGNLLTLNVRVLPKRKMLEPILTELKRAIVHAIGKSGETRMRPILEAVASTHTRTIDAEQLRQLASSYLSIFSEVTTAEKERNDTTPTLTSQAITLSIEAESGRQQSTGRK